MLTKKEVRHLYVVAIKDYTYLQIDMGKRAEIPDKRDYKVLNMRLGKVIAYAAILEKTRKQRERDSNRLFPFVYEQWKQIHSKF